MVRIAPSPVSAMPSPVRSAERALSMLSRTLPLILSTVIRRSPP
ncbi:MAG: hypothetical protein BWY96_01101 [Spirochaetes bacterium ADurb.BinA120]|nr:MAG: hypothetical protein BWY96_01101 [Spirochaetes bacterium ADurb.BinA120]OQB81366.1 MAG: hypothetical protein BWX88_04303 [Planctomycetes bacterium ADurb.Bin126]